MTSVEIVALRTKLNMKQEEMARCLGVSQQVYSTWEVGKHKPHLRRVKHTLRRIAYLADHLLARRSNPDWTL